MTFHRATPRRRRSGTRLPSLRGRAFAPIAALILVWPVACGGDSTTEPEPEPEPGPPARLVFTAQPQDAVAGVAMASPVQVAIQDSAGTVLTDVEAAVTLRLEGGSDDASLLGTTAANVEDGVATFDDVRVDRAASGYTLVATSGHLSGPASDAFAISPAPAVGLGFVAVPEAVEASSPIDPPVRVAVRDEFGNTVTDASAAVTLRLARHARSGELSGTTTVDASDGVATFDDVAIDRSGTDYELLAHSPELPDTARATLDVTFTWAAIEAGIRHTCGLQITGRAFCWGWNGDGQLGDGGQGTNRDRPVAVADDLTFTAISAAERFTCALAPDGTAYCWGGNFDGQLGDGTSGSVTTRDVPGPVASGHAFADLDVDGAHACAVTEDDAAYCWGYNADGELGDGNQGTSRDVPGPVAGGLEFATITAGGAHTCAITRAEEAYCWGRNDAGQLGDGNAPDGRDTPGAVEGGLAFVLVSAGGFASHTCGISSDGTRYCWGVNDDGQLGDGELGTDRDTPGAVEDGVAFDAITTGGYHTCATTSGGEAYCWGSDAYGQLGDGDAGADRDTPAVVAGGLAFAAVSAGGNHSCGVTPAGEAYCWGSNQDGQLGDGTTPGIDADSPVRVLDP